MQAVIDLGTNTFNLAVGEILHGRLFVHHTAMQVVLLRKEALPSGEMTPEAWNRAENALEALVNQARAAGATRIAAVGTSALRHASAATDWIERMQMRFGLPIQLISGSEEARLIWQGVSAASALQEDALLVDIGGGSVEFVHANAQHIHWLRSIEMGMARLQTAVPWSDPIQPAEVSAARNWLQTRLETVRSYAESQHITHLVGSAGAFDTLYTLHTGQSEPAQLAFVPREAVVHWLNCLLDLTRDQRAALRGMPPLRVDMQVAALLLMEALLEMLPQVKGITTTSWALREGKLLELVHSGSEVDPKG